MPALFSIDPPAWLRAAQKGSKTTAAAAKKKKTPAKKPAAKKSTGSAVRPLRCAAALTAVLTAAVLLEQSHHLARAALRLNVCHSGRWASVGRRENSGQEVRSGRPD
eukprot:COSAG02_NODE_303_length_25213_cov_126.386199_9_plen_107_part_00